MKVPKTKRRRYCGFSVSDFKGTYLDKSKIPPWKVLLFINCWLRKRFVHAEVFQNLGLGREASVNWRSFCSEVTNFYFENQPPIGGQDVVVEIDESKFGRSKYGRGRRIEGVWVFGGIERVSKRKFLFPLIERPHRDAETLLPLIRQFILPGSVIVSDEWAAYRRIPEYGYQHRTVNHSEHFVDPVTGNHTQNIERLWKDVKSFVVRSVMRKDYFNQYFSRHIFLTQHPDKIL